MRRPKIANPAALVYAIILALLLIPCIAALAQSQPAPPPTITLNADGTVTLSRQDFERLASFVKRMEEVARESARENEMCHRREEKDRSRRVL